jgi:hypothetical protein
MLSRNHGVVTGIDRTGHESREGRPICGHWPATR